MLLDTGCQEKENLVMAKNWKQIVPARIMIKSVANNNADMCLLNSQGILGRGLSVCLTLFRVLTVQDQVKSQSIESVSFGRKSLGFGECCS